MKHFWALPAVLRVALASQHSFSVLEDLLAYPQYEVVFSDSYVSESYAESLLASATARPAQPDAADSQANLELSHLKTYDAEKASDHDPTDTAETYEPMVLRGQRYLCSIPIVSTTPQNTTTSTLSHDEEEKELMRATDRGWELLKGMQGSCIYYFSGWWSYSFCYNEGVKQFHQLPPSRNVPVYPPVEDRTVQSFMLGTFQDKPARKAGKGRKETSDDVSEGREETGVARLETKGETRYLVQNLGGGTTCDLTGKERKIEVQFHCHPSSADRIGLIKEVSTCSYLMVIYTPRLCNDVAFLPPQENKPNTIACQQVLAEDEVPVWEAAKTAQAHELLGAGDASTADEEQQQRPKRLIVGNIEVGAHVNVGSEGKVIEKSAIVGGGKETHVATVATSDGHMMGEKELRQLKIMDPKDVEKLKGDMQKMAKGKGWKLDVVDTPAGREFRGVIDAEEDGDGPVEEKAEGYEEGEYGEGEGEEWEGSEEVYKEEL